MRKTDTPTVSIWDTIESANRDTKLFEHTEEDTMKIEALSNEKTQEKKTENQGGVGESQKKGRAAKLAKEKEKKEAEMAKEGGGSSGSKVKSQRKTIKKKELLSDELKQNLVAVFNGIEEAEDSIASLPKSSKGDLTCHMISIKDSVCNLASGLLRKGITTKNDVIKTMSTKGESSKSA